MKAIRLRTEYLKDPMGIDIPAPRLFWNCQGGVRQTAYQITAETGGSVIWDSGRVESAQMTHIPYGGTHSSRQRVEWKVRVWDENGTEGPWSEPAFFEMGLLKPEDCPPGGSPETTGWTKRRGIPWTASAGPSAPGTS